MLLAGPTQPVPSRRAETPSADSAAWAHVAKAPGAVQAPFCGPHAGACFSMSMLLRRGADGQWEPQLRTLQCL